jgi:hypothetical protein
MRGFIQKLNVLCNELPRVHNEAQDLTWNDGSVDFRLPPPTDYRVRLGVFIYHHCVKGGVDFLRLGEEVFYKPKHNDKKKRSTKNYNETKT